MAAKEEKQFIKQFIILNPFSVSILQKRQLKQV